VRGRTGAPVEVRASLGSTVAFDALARDEIDAYVEYTGTIWATLMGRTSNPGDRTRVLAEVTEWLEGAHQRPSPGTCCPRPDRTGVPRSGLSRGAPCRIHA